ncbi:MAG: patatin-like phospholipase family protein [Alphaproteobacteria bacterium]|jgi:NTE family protein|nr:patatin-like phospholipase family protein [Alphaproteobacteria bacterium]
MPFLSSFRIGQQTVYPEELRERLQGFALLESVGDGALKTLLAEANWFGLPGGMLLDREGDNDAALFLVVTGSLGVFVADAQGQRRMVAHVPAGETVGEMSLIARDHGHSAQLVALRDTELLRISADGFEALIARHPKVMVNLMRVLVKRLAAANRSGGDGARSKTFAIVPLQDHLEAAPVAHRIANALVEMGSRAAVLDISASEQSAEWFNSFEAAHDVVFYRGDAPDSAWTHQCLRQADRIFLLARADQPLPLRPLDLPAFKERASGLPELLLLHPVGSKAGLPEHFSLRSGLFESHHHIRANNTADVHRLARFIAGRAVGLVLAGGGARGFAHIGVIKALMEAEVPFDHLGGTSIGAIIASGLAHEWGVEELTDRMRSVFVTNNPLDDYTLPLIALLRGRKASRMLKANFGDTRIEELPKPFFCVSSDLTTGRIHEHRAGPLWRALRASVALPGILPPVIHHGHLLVDGGVMNNLPVDVMREHAIGAGPIIACDITGEIDLQAREENYGEKPWRWLIKNRMKGHPSIVSILMRSGTVGSEAQRRIVREQADYLIEPPMPSIGLRDWKKFDQAIREGYETAAAFIEKNGVPLTHVWSDGPAMAIPKRAGSFPS